jgi:DNA-binding transcriptional LysR family regulator
VRESERLAPNVSFRIMPLNTRDPRQWLDDGEIDLAVGYFPKAVIALSAPDAPNAIRHQRLYEGEYVVVMRHGHPLESVELTLDRYCAAHHLLVSFSGRPFGFVDEALAGLGRRRHITMTVNQFFAAGQVVSLSDLLTVLPRHFLEATGLAYTKAADAGDDSPTKALHNLIVRPLPFNVGAVHVEMLWHRRHHRDPAQQWLRALVERAAAEKFPTEKFPI